jgi:prenyltransferase beta subunit
MAISDPAGNKKLDKSKSRFRIDGAVALAMSLGLKGRTKKEPDTGKSFWETMDVD